MSNYLKKFLFTLMILAVPYMSSTLKAMDVENYESSTVRTSKISFAKEDQKDVQSFTKHQINSKVVNSEDSKSSFLSYLLSPVKKVAQSSYNVLDFVTRNPKKTMIIGVVLAYQLVSVAADYYCVFNCGIWGNTTYPAAYPDYSACMQYTPCTRETCLTYHECGAAVCKFANCYLFNK